MSAFDWHRLLLNDNTPAFLAEVAGRTLMAYVVVFVFLKIAGRRGVRQLSLFELVVILTLGSAAGDVTFYDDVPVLPVLTVFVAMICLYRLTTWLTERSGRFGEWLEGKPLVIISDGRFEVKTLNSGNISHDEFLMELRLHGVEHLGQVRLAILEVNGDVSVYFYERDQVKPGLSVLPAQCRPLHEAPEESGLYACLHCGQIEAMAAGQARRCSRCQYSLWSPALSHPRAA
jgi:uncharacterized membrane protein YcaP (DUF421 family)